MGVFTDLFAAAQGIDSVPPAEGERRAVYAGLDAMRDRLGDVDYPVGFTATNEVQSIAFNALIDGGTFTLTITLADGTTFTTAAIAYNANAATIQAAIDTASPASVANAAIVVTGGNLATANVVLTFSGSGASAQNVATTVVGNSLTDGGVPVATPVVTTVTEGQANRPAWALLKLTSVIDGTPPVQGTSEVLVSGSTRAANVRYPDAGVIRALAREAAIADGNDAVEAAILTVAGLSVDGR